VLCKSERKRSGKDLRADRDFLGIDVGGV
jgi:hypothetical protein